MSNNSFEKELNEFIELRGKNLTDKEKHEAVDNLMRKMIPSYYKLKELDEEYRNSTAYAYDQLKKLKEDFDKHLDKYHRGNKEACNDECFESDPDTKDYDKSTFMGYANKIMNEITTSYKEELEQSH